MARLTGNKPFLMEVETVAERRMFAKAVVNSARFLRMPQTSRLLYYDLGVAADDDGVVEAFTVIRTTGAAEDDLRVLASRGFIQVLNEDLVTYITDWKKNNLIRPDRYHPSVYSELLVKITDGNQRFTNGLPVVAERETQVSIGKVSTGEDSVVVADKPPCPPPLPDTAFGPELRSAFERWLLYKKERREGYKPTGLNALITQIKNNASAYGEHGVAQLIETSMASGWKGIAFDRLKQGNRPQATDRNRLRSNSDYQSCDDFFGGA